PCSGITDQLGPEYALSNAAPARPHSRRTSGGQSSKEGSMKAKGWSILTMVLAILILGGYGVVAQPARHPGAATVDPSVVSPSPTGISNDPAVCQGEDGVSPAAV